MSRSLLMLVSAVLFSLCQIAFAQSIDDHRWTFDFGGGVSPLVGAISDRLDTGWHVAVGGGYNFAPAFSTSLRYTYNGYGVSQSVLAAAAVPDGNARMWSITVDPTIRVPTSGRLSPYVVGGVGYYRRTVEFTQPSVTPATIFDPFFGLFIPTLVPANIVLGRITRSGVGGSLGAGFNINLGTSGVKFFTEARYHYADTGSIPTRMVPVTFGIRW